MVKYVRVDDKQITNFNLPTTGILKNGRTVSGYHLLDEEILLDEGWLPLEDIQPDYDTETQYLINDGYEILEDKVIKKYRVEDVPEPTEPEPSEMDLLKDEIEELKQTIDTMLGGEDIE